MRRRRKLHRVTRMADISRLCPRTPDQLHHFVNALLGLKVPRQAIVAGNSAPFDYLVHAFFEKHQAASGDVIVWANRGGGKTQLGAVATLLDLLFKPGIQVRILGGSLDQSSLMYAYLKQLIDRPMLRGLTARPPTERRMQLLNGSCVEIMTQSHRSVRGHHVHKLRCDEVELFKRDIWQAAQTIAHSGNCGPVAVRGTVEALSTMHEPCGLMRDVVERPDGPRVIRWCALDVIERCPPQRHCHKCELWRDCLGRAKEADGFLRIDDLIAQRRRTSDETWDSEVMCRKPRREHSVYPNFDTLQHMAPAPPPTPHDVMIAGMDFGLRSPLVMLWARVTQTDDPAEDWLIEVVDEHVAENLILQEHLNRISRRDWPMPAWVGVDPAGAQRNSQTGMTDIQVLRRAGYTVRAAPSNIRGGIEAVRRRVDRDLLRIDPRCTHLIEALRTYPKLNTYGVENCFSGLKS